MITLFLFIIGLFILSFWILVIKEGQYLEWQTKRFDQVNALNNGPSVSVVFAAKNEEEKIAECLSSLNNQTYENLQIVAVNDRSTDRTGDHIKKAESLSQRIRSVEVSVLPEGWLGKCHALHLGSQATKSDWILFTDADVQFERDIIARVIAFAESEKIDHLILTPFMTSKSAMLSAMQLIFALNLVAVSRPSQFGKSSNFYIGSGSFNLIRRSTSDKFRGHLPLHLEVVDDVMLGKLAASTGAKQMLIDGRSSIRLEWYSSVKKMILGLEKNFFAATRYSVGRVAFTLLIVASMYLLPYLMVLFSSHWLWWFYLTDLIIMHFVLFKACIRIKYPTSITLLTPIAGSILAYTLTRSTIVTLKNKGVKWRETFYPISLLKENMIK